MTFEVELKSNWKPLSEIDIKKPAKYLIRYGNPVYNSCWSILEISSNTWKNGMWVFINGQSEQLSQTIINNNEFAGPFKF